MDPAIAAELKMDPSRKLPLLSPKEVVDDLNQDRAAKFMSKASAKSKRDALASDLLKNSNDNAMASALGGQGQLPADAAKLSLEQRRLQDIAREMADITKIKSTWSSQSQKAREARKADSSSARPSRDSSASKSSKSPYSSVVMTEEQRSIAQAVLKDAIKVPKGSKTKAWSWKKILRVSKKHASTILEMHGMDEMAKMKRRGKVVRPVRPPPARILWRRAFLRDKILSQRSSDTPYRLPRSVMDDTRKEREAKEELPKETIDSISRYFVSRRTTHRFLALFILAILSYELWLAYDEYYFDEHPEALEQDIRHYLSSNGEFTANRARKLREDHVIQLHRDDEWHGIKKGWMPNAIWRLWMRSEAAKEDFVIFALLELFNSSRSYITDFNLSFFMKHSRFWTDRALDAHFPEHLISSLKSNGMLPDSVSSNSRWSMHNALKSFDASTQFLSYGGIAALLHAASENSLMSTEALLLRTTLSSDEKVKFFWTLPESDITAQLESMILFCDQKPLLVASTVSTLLSCQMGPVSPYHQRLLVLILERLEDPRVTSTALGEKLVLHATKNFLSFLPATGKSHDSIAQLRKKIMAQTSRTSHSLPEAKLHRFEKENVLQDPSLAWLAVSLPISALWISVRYNSNALWNGVGALPLKLRLAQVASRAAPALLAAYSWLVFDSYSHQLVETLWSKSLKDSSNGENGAQKVKYSYAAATYGLDSSKPVSSISFGTLLGLSKSLLLWQYPFIWAPQIISEVFAWPITKFRQWRFYRLESQKR